MSKETISNYQRDRVLILYRKNDIGTMVHTGIYIGWEKYIHAKGKYGVVQESMTGTLTHSGDPVGLY